MMTIVKMIEMIAPITERMVARVAIDLGGLRLGFY